jgi:hypothetical protein
MDVAGRLLALRCVVTHALAAPEREALKESLARLPEAERRQFAQESDSQSERYWDAVRSSPIFPYLSPWEREFAATTILTMSTQQHIDGLWRIESAQVLAWALRLIPEMPAPDEQAGSSLLRSEILNRPTSFLNSAVLRIQAEIDHAREVAELWHWRSRTEGLIREGRAFPSDEETIRQGLRSYHDVVRMAVNAAHTRGDVAFVVEDDFGVRGKSFAKLSAEEWSEIRSISLERLYALNWLCGYSPHNDWDNTPTDT